MFLASFLQLKIHCIFPSFCRYYLNWFTGCMTTLHCTPVCGILGQFSCLLIVACQFFHVDYNLIKKNIVPYIFGQFGYQFQEGAWACCEGKLLS